MSDEAFEKFDLETFGVVAVNDGRSMLEKERRQRTWDAAIAQQKEEMECGHLLANWVLCDGCGGDGRECTKCHGFKGWCLTCEAIAQDREARIDELKKQVPIMAAGVIAGHVAQALQEANRERDESRAQSETYRLQCIELGKANNLAEAKYAEIRGPSAPEGHETCADCGRAMVWQRTGDGHPGSWMCPNCVLGRLKSLEGVLAVAIAGKKNDEWLDWGDMDAALAAVPPKEVSHDHD